MPYIHVKTNVEVDDADALLKALSGRVAEALNKPESYVMAQCSDCQAMIFAGSGKPLAFVELKSLGLATTETARISEQICDLLQDSLGIVSDRIYIEFAAPERTMWGWDRATF